MNNKNNDKRVVITGMGIVCPMGYDVETVWQEMLVGKNGFAATTIFDASTFPTTFSAEVKDYNLSKHISKPEIHSSCNRSTGFLLRSGTSLQTGCNRYRD